MFMTILLLIGLLLVIFSIIFKDFENEVINGNSFIYSLAWEDPRLDFKYLTIKDHNVLMLTTGGCNVLNTLLKDPKKIVTVDISKNQNALLDLKIAAIKSLDYETFWLLFGKGKVKNFSLIYKNYLRKNLQLETSKDFWDKNKSIFKIGLYHSGGVANMISYLNLINPNNKADDICNIGNLKDQYKFYKSNIEPNIFNNWTKYFAKLPLFSVFTGVHINQIRTICEGDNYDIAFNMVKKSYDNIFKKFSVRDENYFIYGLIKGELKKNNCPEYLKKANFDFLKNNVNKIKIQTAYVSDYLEKTNIKFSRFILLDHLDWMTYKEILRETKLIKKNNKKIQGIFRSGNKLPWYLNILKNDFKLEDLTFESDNDRLGTYPGFYKFNS